MPRKQSEDEGTTNQAAATEFPADVALELAHALVQSLADEQGFDVLFVKGIVANHHAVRPFRVSTDVDVWLREEDKERLVALLQQRGWYLRPESFAHRAFVNHSTTMMHSVWPCDIDIHVRFPGLFDDEAFTRLRDRREEMEVAGTRLDVVDFCGSFVIGAVHALRQSYLPGSALELQYLERIWHDRLDEERRREIVELALDVGGAEPMRPFFHQVGAHVPAQNGYTRELAEWRIQTRQLSRTSMWLALIAEQPLHRRPGLILRALFPTKNDLQIDHPEAAGGTLPALVARGTRILRACRSFIGSWKTWRQVKKDVPGNVVGVVPDERPARARRTGDQLLPLDHDKPRTAVASAPHIKDVRAASVHVADGVLVTRRGERLYLLASRASKSCSPLRLEGSSVAIWEEISTTDDDLVSRVADRYGVSNETVADDVNAFVAQLARHQLVVAAT